MTNQAIIAQFERLIASLQVEDDKKFFFQIRSYQRVVQTIRDLPKELHEIYQDQKDLEHLEGIGPAIEKKIIELLTTGKCEEIERHAAPLPAAMFPLLEIAGIGAKRAYQLAVALKLTDPHTAINDLEQHAKEGNIRTIEGFGEKSEQDIIESIERFHASSASMTYAQAMTIAEPLIAHIKQAKATQDATPLGSLRRKKLTVRDIDIGVATDDFASVKKHVKTYSFISKVLADGDNLLRVLVDTSVQVDIKSSPPSRWGAFIQHFTGSKEHNIKLRELALKQDKSLSEHGVKIISENMRLVEFADEKEFYAFLGLRWIPPEDRIGANEIEQAKMKDEG